MAKARVKFTFPPDQIREPVIWEVGKRFDLMVYPNRSHGISEGAGTTLHVYKLIARYFLEHLPPGQR